jgi:hypothetical protein
MAIGDAALLEQAPGRVQYRFDLARLARACCSRNDRRVSLAQIRYFVAVAEERNVGRAAARLHVAQPPVSRQIRALESEIGTPLFQRTARGMDLLPAGEAFLDHARLILAAVDQARDAALGASRPAACPDEERD